MSRQQQSRKEKLKQAGIRRFGSEIAWRTFLRESSAKSRRNSVGTGGFAKMRLEDPERLKEISRKGGHNGRKQKLGTEI